MTFLNVLKRTTIISAAAGILALGSTQAQAQSDTSVLGHIGVSVQGTLSVTETAPIKFGNVAFGAGACAGGNCAGDATITLSHTGNRTLVTGTDLLLLAVGVDSDGGGPIDDIVADGANYGTGAQSPGFYSITNGDGISNVYVTFANSTGAIMDSNHPNNYVSLDGAGVGMTDYFRVSNFTWEMDDPLGAGPSTSGYAGTAFTTDGYGNFVACAASCDIRVGAQLRTVATKPAVIPGPFTGTFYLMVNY